MPGKRNSRALRRGGYESGPALVSQLKPPPRGLGVGARPPSPSNNSTGTKSK
jgi:hypothetical protein